MAQFVIKHSGVIEPYNEEKVINSLNRVGVPPVLQPQVLEHVRARFKGEYVSTDDLFKFVFSFLKTTDKKASLRLNLRRAIQDLGPTGFPFEKYVARVFQSEGYKTTVDAHLMGECITHEIDLILEKDGRRHIVEAKFHNDMSVITDVHVALYTYARFLDLQRRNKIDTVWIITNTKLSSDATVFASCKGIKVLGWNYPTHENLQHFVEHPLMYPVTILSELTVEEKQHLIEDNILLCSDLINLTDAEIKSFQFITPQKLRRAIASARVLLAS